MISSVLILSSVFLSPAAEPVPQYTLIFAETRRIEAVLTYEITMPKLAVQEWIVYAAKAPELSGQIQPSTTMEPGGKASVELSPERRPVMMARVSAQNGRSHEIILHVKYQATLRSRELTP